VHPAFGTLDDARATLQKHFGYPDFRPPQRRAIQSVISGHDALIVLPTGGGKSLCFQVPALMRNGLTVVISPLISLMKDQVDALERRNLSAAFINSTLSSGEVSNRMARARDGSLKLLYLAPERMDGGRTLQQLAQIGVSMLVVDEAHCISEWGHDFRPSYRRIGTIRNGLGTPQTVALTATATPHVRDDIIRQLALAEPRVVIGGFDRTNLTYHVSPTRTQPDKDKACVQWLREITGPGIVYAPTRKSVERVASMLTRARIKAVAYHAGLDDALRQRAQNAFMDERCRVIVATSAFGMGIDKPDVRLVVHHAMPGSLEAYYQEAGRAGRDGRPSTCVLLHSYPDRFTHEFFITNAHPERSLVEQTWRTLRAQASHDHVVPLSLDGLVEAMPGKSSDRTIGAALRVLAGAGVVTVEPASVGRVWIRLLATPARITHELSGERDFDREVLRTIWRAVGKRFAHGASVDLDGLPPGFGGAAGVVPVLERLEAEQFVTWNRSGGGFRLDPRSVDPHWLPVDWQLIEQRRHADLSRLDAMQRYSQTRACRRAFVLRYFGDPDARPHCNGCDRCLGTTSELPERTSVRATPRRTRTRPL
jgi:ATP-dependent DNA helicase RecQ